MQVKQSVKLRDVLWSYLTIILNAGINILILPAVLRYLPPNELGLWYVFVSFGAFVSIFEGSVNAILIRNVGYACSGARFIQKTGYDETFKTSNVNIPLLKSIIDAASRFFFALSALLFIILATGGTYYIKSIAIGIDFSYWLTAWLLYTFSAATNMYFVYWWPVLLGMNLVEESNKSIITAKIIQLILTIFGMKLGYGLIAMAIAYLFSGLTARSLNVWYFKKRVAQEYFTVEKSHNFKEIFLAISYNSSRLMLILIGNYLVTNSIVFLISYYLGLEITAKYGLTLQIITFSNAIGATFFNASFPSLNLAKINKNLIYQKKIMSLGIIILLITNVFVLLFLVLWGNAILSYFSKQQILATIPLLILSITVILESITGFFTRYISTSNQLPYVKSIIISGLATVLISLLALHFWKVNVVYLLVIRLAIQCLYNNWKWPVYALNELNMKYTDIIKISFFEFKNKLMGSLGSDLHI